jgi:hypothetical protein
MRQTRETNASMMLTYFDILQSDLLILWSRVFKTPRPLICNYLSQILASIINRHSEFSKDIISYYKENFDKFIYCKPISIPFSDDSSYDVLFGHDSIWNALDQSVHSGLIQNDKALIRLSMERYKILLKYLPVEEEYVYDNPMTEAELCQISPQFKRVQKSLTHPR